MGHLEKAIQDAPLNQAGRISRHNFFNKVYDPARGNAVKLIRALWSMAKIARDKESIDPKMALQILHGHLGNAPFWEPCKCDGDDVVAPHAHGHACAHVCATFVFEIPPPVHGHEC